MLKALLLVIAGAVLGVAGADQPAGGAGSGVSRVMLGAGSPAAAPGQELSLRRVTFAPNARVPAEIHPGMQVIYVVSGHLTLRILGGTAIVRRVQPDGSMSAPQEVQAGPTPVVLGPGDTAVETETLVLNPSNASAEPLVIMTASLLQAGKPQSVPVTQPIDGP
jgi:hypothetical protein